MGLFDQSVFARVNALAERVTRLEATVARQQQVIGRLCIELGMDPDEMTDGSSLVGSEAVDLHDIRAELRAGRKINAIKMYRDRTGTGLKEAKQFVDALAAAMGVH